MAANPAAIAWYLKRSEDLLHEHRERVQSIRLRGGQLAGFSGAVLALAGANADSVLGALHGLPHAAAGISLLIGTISLVASFEVALWGTLQKELISDLSAREVANYTSPRFIDEADLWRVHVRAISGLQLSIERTTEQGDEAALAVRKAEFLFLVGLSLVGATFGTLILTVIV